MTAARLVRPRATAKSDTIYCWVTRVLSSTVSPRERKSQGEEVTQVGTDWWQGASPTGSCVWVEIWRMGRGKPGEEGEANVLWAYTAYAIAGGQGKQEGGWHIWVTLYCKIYSFQFPGS